MKMKLKALHIFLILLGALLLCGVLGGKCVMIEGMDNQPTTMGVGPAGDHIIYQAPPGKSNELDNLSSSASGAYSSIENEIDSMYNTAASSARGAYSSIENDVDPGANTNNSVIGSLLSNIKSDVGKVKKNIKSLANKTVIEYSSNSPQTSGGSLDLPAVHHSNIPRRKAPITVNRSQIPAGDEDLYILKSQIVPPVCPACPSTTTCPRDTPPPPCPPCARCPEPAFECKKVPNYASNNSQYLPRPVLSDFSQFGM
jgi:hypothetical protein